MYRFDICRIACSLIQKTDSKQSIIITAVADPWEWGWGAPGARAPPPLSFVEIYIHSRALLHFERTAYSYQKRPRFAREEGMSPSRTHPLSVSHAPFSHNSFHYWFLPPPHPPPPPPQPFKISGSTPGHWSMHY